MACAEPSGRKKYRNNVTGLVVELIEVTDHPASSYGQPVLVDVATGHAVDRCWWTPVEAESKERMDA